MEDFKLATPDFISYLVEKFDKGEQYTEDELINCYCYQNGKYITCFNVSGDCFIEKFKNFNTVVDYFTTDKDLDILYQEDQAAENKKRLTDLLNLSKSANKATKSINKLSKTTKRAAKRMKNLLHKPAAK